MKPLLLQNNSHGINIRWKNDVFISLTTEARLETHFVEAIREVILHLLIQNV